MTPDGVTLATYGGWPGVLGRLTGGEDLDGAAAKAAMEEVLAGEATEAQIAAFMVSLRLSKETTEELNGLLDAILEAAACPHRRRRAGSGRHVRDGRRRRRHHQRVERGRPGGGRRGGPSGEAREPGGVVAVRLG